MTAAGPGEGHLRFVHAGARTVVHTARATSPLRLLLPGNHGTAAWAIQSSLGGGLVDGDALSLRIEVEAGASALVGTQATTKAYRSPGGTSQSLDASVARGALLAVVPDPVSCFAGARYSQRVDVALQDESASLVLVDGLTCGRAARGERWAFARYASRLHVSCAGRPLVRDAVLLDPAHGALADRAGAFDAFATVVVVGPRAAAVRDRLFERPSLTAASRMGSLYAVTALGEHAAIARVAATSARNATDTVRALLSPFARIVGDDPFARRW